MKYLGLTRGGNSGAIAILEFNGEAKYYDSHGLTSLMKNAQDPLHKKELERAIMALEGVVNYEDIPEFESGIPQQGTLF